MAGNFTSSDEVLLAIANKTNDIGTLDKVAANKTSSSLTLDVVIKKTSNPKVLISAINNDHIKPATLIDLAKHNTNMIVLSSIITKAEFSNNKDLLRAVLANPKVEESVLARVELFLGKDSNGMRLG